MNEKLWSMLSMLSLTALLASCGGGQTSSTPPGNDSSSTVTVQPSAQSQSVAAGGVTVTVPGGLLSKAAVLSVVPSAAAAQLPKPAASAAMLASYDIALGDTSSFAQKITLEIPYDTATLDSAAPEGKNLWVSSWNEQQKAWEDQVVEVDTARKKLIVHTDHLSTWVYWKLQGYTYVGAANGYGPFEVYYDPKATVLMTNVDKSYSMKDLATDAMVALTNAKKAYSDAGYQLPSSQIKAIIQEDTSQMYGITGNIHLKRDTLTSAALLQHDAGHELFHVVQNQYYNVYGMGYKHWLMESTSDYMSALIHNDWSMLPPLEATYFDESLTVNDDPHSYENSHFMRWLVDVRKVNFKAMWDAVYARSSWGDDAVAAFQAYVGEATGKAFSTVFQDWVHYAMFDASVPMAAVGNTSFTVPNKQTPSKLTDLKVVAVPSYAAKVVIVGTSNLSATQARSVKANVAGLSTGNTVEIWKVSSPDGLASHIDRTKAVLQKVLVSDSDSATIDLTSNDYLYCVVINTGTAAANVTVTATALVPTITAVSPGSGKIGSTVSVTGTGFGAAQGTVYFGTGYVTGSSVTAAAVNSWSDTNVSATVPVNASMDPAGNVYVVTAGGIASSGFFFQVLPDSSGGGGGTSTTKFTSGNGTVTQNLSKDLNPLTTKLLWQKQDDGQLRTWDDAKAYCEGLSLGGYSTGWTLPTLTRLAGILDTTQAQPPFIDANYFTNTKKAIYWTGTVTSDGFNAYYVDFSDASSSTITKNSYDQLVRCVRALP